MTKFGYYPFDHANAGQLHWKENGLNKRVYYAYNDAGQVTHQWGAADYPLQYDYNGYGQMTELKTYQADDGAMWSGSTKPGAFATAIASTTTWQYDPASGVLVHKLDANLKGASYGYYDNKLLASRLWARGLITGYAYNGAGDLETIDYGDQITQDVTHTYHRDGRRKTTFDAAGLHTYHYENLGGLPSGETISGGLLDGVSYSYPNDGLGRRQSFSASLGGQQLLGVGYGYTPESRLHTVTAGPLVTTYGYVANSDLIGSVIGSRGGATMLASSRVYDNVARLDVITNTTGAGPVLSSHDYDYDAAHRRYKATRENGDYWSYGYNDRNEVTGGSKHHSDTILYEGMGYGYGFDAIGNRKTSTVAYEGASLTTTYTPNALNQYASIASPGSFVVSGRAETAAAVSVNTTAATRQDDYYHHKIDVDNTAGAVWSDVDVEGDLTGQLSAKGGGRYTPAASLAPTHDDDGNLTFDGRWINVWNGENRLIAAETAPTAPIGMPKQRLEMIYDAQGRRISRKLFDWNVTTAAWDLKSANTYLYDWWNCVAVLDGAGAVVESYVWGTDLAGSVAGSTGGPGQGAGGVGGLLAAWLPTDTGLTSVFYAYDGNGNVMGLASGTTGAEVAKYDYTPFGEVAERDGVLAATNGYRFSTKPEDAQLEMLYYGFRYYIPSTGRWASRDPIQERGGENLYAVVKNVPLSQVDVLGNTGVPAPDSPRAYPEALPAIAEAAGWTGAATAGAVAGTYLGTLDWENTIRTGAGKMTDAATQLLEAAKSKTKTKKRNCTCDKLVKNKKSIAFNFPTSGNFGLFGAPSGGIVLHNANKPPKISSKAPQNPYGWSKAKAYAARHTTGPWYRTHGYDRGHLLQDKVFGGSHRSFNIVVMDYHFNQHGKYREMERKMERLAYQTGGVCFIVVAVYHYDAAGWRDSPREFAWVYQSRSLQVPTPITGIEVIAQPQLKGWDGKTIDLN